MPAIHSIRHLRPSCILPVLDHLDTHLKPCLSPDVSTYAPGRTRAWLEIEAPLGPTQTWKQGLHSDMLWPWLTRAWQKVWPATAPQLGLAIHGDHGIRWHRDATYACGPCMIVNLGPCTFQIDQHRNGPNGHPVDIQDFRLSSGELLAFDCKHQHRGLDAAPQRWSVVLWRRKTHPPEPIESFHIA